MLNSATLMNVQRGINDEDIAEIILGQNLQSGECPSMEGWVFIELIEVAHQMVGKLV